MMITITVVGIRHSFCACDWEVKSGNEVIGKFKIAREEGMEAILAAATKAVAKSKWEDAADFLNGVRSDL